MYQRFLMILTISGVCYFLDYYLGWVGNMGNVPFLVESTYSLKKWLIGAVIIGGTMYLLSSLPAKRKDRSIRKNLIK